MYRHRWGGRHRDRHGSHPRQRERIRMDRGLGRFSGQRGACGCPVALPDALSRVHGDARPRLTLSVADLLPPRRPERGDTPTPTFHSHPPPWVHRQQVRVRVVSRQLLKACSFERMSAMARRPPGVAVRFGPMADQKCAGVAEQSVHQDQRAGRPGVMTFFPRLLGTLVGGHSALKGCSPFLGDHWAACPSVCLAEGFEPVNLRRVSPHG